MSAQGYHPDYTAERGLLGYYPYNYCCWLYIKCVHLKISQASLVPLPWCWKLQWLANVAMGFQTRAGGRKELLWFCKAGFPLESKGTSQAALAELQEGFRRLLSASLPLKLGQGKVGISKNKHCPFAACAAGKEAAEEQRSELPCSLND